MSEHDAHAVEKGGSQPMEVEPIGLLINGYEFIPEDVYQRHLPFAVPPGVKVQRLYVEADRG